MITFDKDKLKQYIEAYKANFEQINREEIYKWCFVKIFQDNWDINALNFKGMFAKAVADKTITPSGVKKENNILVSSNYNPRYIILKLSEKEPEIVRNLFIELFNESEKLDLRNERFQYKTKELYEKYKDKEIFGKSFKWSHQDNLAVSYYLFLKYPEKYYITKFGVIESCASALECEWKPKKGKFENIEKCREFFDGICEVVKEDGDLLALSKERLENDLCYKDENFKILTQDIAYFIYKEQNKEKNIDNDNFYTKKDFLKKVFMTPENYDKLYMLLKRKKNIILQGAPGVGKTYAAKRLAYSLIGAKDDSKIEMVQFHQNYSYEDFVMGYRPSENGFNLQKGVFYEFCQKARNDLDNNYYFIIDEINRGNLSSIFGELLMLIESDYRDEPVALVYKKEEKFSVPPNVYIIGMMNTADRSIAMIDYALRRRFSFFTMQPGFETEGFKQIQKEAHSEIFNELIKRLIELNKDIVEDTSLGEGFCIGHSYFVYDKDKSPTGGVDAWLKNIIEYDICPMIDEYWFDDKDKANGWKKTLLGVFDK